MNQILKHDAWNVIEEGLHGDHNEMLESCFTLGNGKMGHRGFFEEHYSGHTYQGCYLAGIFYQRNYRPMGWKKGMPDQFTRMLNSTNWIGIDVHIDGELLDLNICRLKDFVRILRMKEGYLERSYTAKLVSGKEVKISATRFCSMNNKELGAVRFSIKALNFEGNITLTPYIDCNVLNRDDNWDGPYWTEVDNQVKNRSCFLVTESKGQAERVCTGMKMAVYKNKQEVKIQTTQQQEDKYAACTVDVRVKPNDEVILYKYAAVVSTLNHEKSKLLPQCQEVVRKAYKKGFDKLLKKQAKTWEGIWDTADVSIEGDVAAQQAIRFDIFQLYQSFDGKDAKTSLSPNGFSGEQWGGNILWDTELFALPFYLATSDSKVARNLLLFRYGQLPQAIENAKKLGIGGGAALFPAMTLNGTESHPGWEVALGGIHRNGAIAYSIFEYVQHTGDTGFLASHGLEMLLAIARFWAQRVHWSESKGQYVIHGTSGPNEFEVNVNNNWYTNFMASWCLKYTLEAVELVAAVDTKQWSSWKEKHKFDQKKETERWQAIIEKIYLPKDEVHKILLQHEVFLDKEPIDGGSLKKVDQMILQNWSWDQVQRSSFLQRPDVLLGLYLFEAGFSAEELRSNFGFYEPKTLQGHGLSSNIHSILAARLGERGTAWDQMRLAYRFNLDDSMDKTVQGLDLLNMAGNWLAITRGVAGLQIVEGLPSFSPWLPADWDNYTIKFKWRESNLEVRVNIKGTTIINNTDKPAKIVLYGKTLDLEQEVYAPEPVAPVQNPA